MILNIWYLTRLGVSGKFERNLRIVSHLAVRLSFSKN